jgi:hypothetical protein
LRPRPFGIRIFVCGLKAATCLLAVCVVAGCVGPARTHEDFQLKAKSTAETTLSAVGTATLVTQLAKDDRAFANYLSVLAGDAEAEADAAQSAFDSIQPPNKRADELRSQLDDLLSSAQDAIVDVRIAVRRGQLDEAAKKERALERSARELQRFIEAQP